MKRILAVAALAACGNTPASKPDAAPDGGNSVIVPDGLPANAGPITVHAPYPDASNRITPGATVLFYDGQGRLLDRVVTGADGKATGNAVDGSTVMVLPPYGVRAAYYTWIAVTPGDELTAQRDPVPAAAAPAERHISVTTNRYYSSKTATYALGTVGLSASQIVQPGTDDISFDATLAGDAPLVNDLVVRYKEPTATGFEVKHAVSLDAGVIDLRPAHWGIGYSYNATVALPPVVDWLTAYHKSLSGGRVLWQDEATVDWSVTPVALGFVIPEGVGDGAALMLSYGSSIQTVALSYNAPPANLSWQQATPIADAVNLASGNSATWYPPATLAASVGVELTLTSANAAWQIVMPPGQMSFTPPTIPSDIQPPPAMDTARVAYAGGNDPAGYRALRSDPDVFDLYRWAQVLPATPGVYRFAGH